MTTTTRPACAGPRNPRGSVPRPIRVVRLRTQAASPNAVTIAPDDDDALILVAGASGGVGQLVSQKLLARGFRVRALSRSKAKCGEVLPGAECFEGDLTKAETLASCMEGVSAVCCCAGTTAFPSLRWLGGNDPEANTVVGMANLIAAAQTGAQGLRRFVFVSSAGVKRYGSPPYSVMNAFGVLTSKEAAEDALVASGLPYTIVRPCRLTDAPYTSYDLNTLIKGESGARKEVVITKDEVLDGETSRIATAEACVQSLMLECTANAAFSIESVLGEGPGEDSKEWASRLTTAGM